ncbi:hypothetical protein DEIPH_ctg064orf0049 [Deinococcus phoenicis]|uniref:Esterase n=1 Tax=Deinococcus phoenicis TaxID=1476583 RepID=A0A016QLK9_9DEIO|nr:alpha/beta hydrolase-fold protein [Deinococcus phoenicis]EYB66881.1 hypothetical protein DEIPH_ctg064orf0049 [Deinococcus phoenicis]
MQAAPGTVQTLLVPWPALDTRREVKVWLPPDYQRSGRPLPVAYLLDGQNVFGPGIPHGSWKADLAGAALAAKGLELLLVALPHGSEARIPEYTVRPDSRHGGGNGATTLRALVEAVKPWVDARFRTLAGQRHTALIGSSLGGLLALEAGLRFPSTFGFLGVLSPSVWWADRAALRDAARVNPRWGQTYHLTTGDAEGDRPAASARQVEETRALHAVLTGRGAQATLSVTPGGHDECTWAAQLPGVLRAFGALLADRA